jgi:hypothetical protein
MTKRYTKSSDGFFHINGKKYKMLTGSREQVMNGTAYKRPGKDKNGKELTKKCFVKNKWGRIVSLKKHKTAKKEKRLEKHGYFAKKGKFGYVKKGGKSRRKSMKKGGDAENPTTKPPLTIMGGEDAHQEVADAVAKL